MISDDDDFWIRCRRLFFNVAVTLGLWIVVGASLFLAKTAQDEAGSVQQARGGDRPAAPVAASLQGRSKDDIDTAAVRPQFVSLTDRGTPLPLARPPRADGVAALPRPKAEIARAAPRPVPAGLADAERFDRCSPACESRDPLLPYAAASAGGVTASSSEAYDAGDGIDLLQRGLAIVDAVSGTSMSAIERGSDYLSSVIDGLR